MSDTVYVVYESVAQSHDTDRTDLANESVVTFPIVGVYDLEGDAKDRISRVPDIVEGEYDYTEVPADWF